MFNQLHNQLHSLHHFFVKRIRFLISPKSHLNCQCYYGKCMPFRALRKLSVEERARALGRIEPGIHPQDVANQFSVYRSTIIRLCDRHRATGTLSDRPRSGRPKVINQHEDRYIAVTVARRHFVDGPSLKRKMRQQRGPGARRISVQTVRNRVRASGFSSRKRAKKS